MPSRLDVSAEAAAAAPKPMPVVPTASLEAVRKLKEENPVVDYRPYPHAPHYVIGDDGSVWSTRRKMINRAKPLKLRLFSVGATRSQNPDIYSRAAVTIFHNGEQKQKKVHSMVLETFVGARPVGLQGAHNNGKHPENSAANLRWATPKENAEDRTRHGHQYRPIGEKHHRTKLTDAKVIEILKRTESGATQKTIAGEFNVSVTAISKIILGINWRHIERAKFNLTPIGNLTA